MGKISFGSTIIYDSASEPAIIRYKTHVLPIVGSGTSFAITMPTIVSAGDLLVAYTFTRSTITAPEGWTLIQNAENNGNTQWGQMHYKAAVADDAGATLTFTQASNLRYGLGLVVASAPSTGFALEDSAKTKSAGDAAQPSITSLGVGRFYVGMMSIYSLATGTGYLGGETWAIVSVPYRADNRIIASIASGNAGAIPAWSFYDGMNANDSSAIAAVFKPT